jgi:tetratricopeptide (TPR) repeat protein
MARFYIRRETGPMYGPFSPEQLIQYIREGTIQGNEKVSRDKIHWHPITNDPAFYDLLMAKLDGKDEKEVDKAVKTVMATQAMTDPGSDNPEAETASEEEIIPELSPLPDDDEEDWSDVLKRRKKKKKKKKRSPAPPKRSLPRMLLALLILAVMGFGAFHYLGDPTEAPKVKLYYFDVFSYQSPIKTKSDDDPYLAEKKYYEGKRKFYKDTPYQYVLAAEDFQKALAYDHTSVAAIASYLESLLHLYRVRLISPDTLEKVSKDLRIAAKKYPNSPHILRAQALNQILIGEEDSENSKVISLLEDALKKIPNDSESETLYGYYYWLNNKPELALEKLSAAIEHQRFEDKYMVFAYYLLSQYHKSQENLHDLTTLYQVLFELSPIHPYVLYEFATQAFEKTDGDSQAYGSLLIRTLAALGRYLPIDLHEFTFSSQLKRRADFKLSDEKINQLKVFLAVRFPQVITSKAFITEFENFELATPDSGISEVEKALFSDVSALNKVATEFFTNPTKTEVGIDLYLISLKMDPKQADIYQKLAEYYAFIRTPSAQAKTLEFYDKALSLNPGLSDVAFKMFDHALHYYDHKKAATVLHRYEKHWEKTKPGKAKDYRLWLSYGKLYERLGDVQKALEQLMRARGSAPNDVKILSLMAKVATKAGYHTDAVVLMKQAIKFDPDNIDFQSRLSVLNAKQGRVMTSKKWADDRLKNDPNDPWGLLTLGKIHVVFKELDKAKDILERATKLLPEDIEGWEMLADVYRKQGLEDKAIDAYKAISDNYPNYTLGYSEAAEYAMYLGRKEEALKLYLKIQKINFRFPEVNIKIARLFKELVYPNEAIRAYQLAIEVNPFQIKYQIELGDYLMFNEYYDAAEKYFERVHEEYPKNVIAMIYLARVNRIMGTYSKAQAYASAALKLDPKSPDANKELGLAFFYMEHKKPAKEYLKKYLDLNPVAADREEIQNLMR